MIQGHFRAGPADEIDEGLWQGGLPTDAYALKRAGFDAVVLCAQELQPRVEFYEGVQVARQIGQIRRFGLDVIEAPTDDDVLTTAEAVIAADAARQVVGLLAQGKKVLVTCQQGRNRSGLVSALVLVMRRGVSGVAAIETVRQRRRGSPGEAMVNRTFCAFLEKIPARAGRRSIIVV